MGARCSSEPEKKEESDEDDSSWWGRGQNVRGGGMSPILKLNLCRCKLYVKWAKSVTPHCRACMVGVDKLHSTASIFWVRDGRT
jgi:hypothetical protein